MQIPAPLSDVPKTILDCLAQRAQVDPGRPAFTFLRNGEEERGTLTYEELWRTAGGVATALRALCAPGERALLLFPAGLEFVQAYFGCLRAGVVPVPLCPPRPRRDAAPILAVAADCGARAVLTTRALLPMLQKALAEAGPLSWLAVDLDAPFAADGAAAESGNPEDLACLQYTSGSTSRPKGVKISHANLVADLRMIRETFELPAAPNILHWLPHYHDMGLIGGILSPVFVGGHSYLMSPMAFLQSPLRWLAAISRFRVDSSGAPNFAYEICVQEIRPEQRGELDLSSWRVAYCGAEPIRAATLQSFQAAFSPHGLRDTIFLPCYGLAEGTLLVSGIPASARPTFRSFDDGALSQGRVVPRAADDPGAKLLVGCGAPVAPAVVRVVDPVTQRALPPDWIGELWVAGPQVAQGYWQSTGEAAEGFRAFAADTGEGPFLRTGDLGFFHDGHLFVTGRCKDLIIVDGRNVYPQDLEATVAASHPAFAGGRCVAFPVETGEGERVVVVAEVAPAWQSGPEGQAAAAEEAARRAVQEKHEVHLHDLMFVPPGRVPVTTSGKIRRGECRLAYQAGQFEKT